MATIVIDSWDDVGLNVNMNATSVKTKCPECSETKTHKNDKCLSVNTQKGVAKCHKCGNVYVIRSENKSGYQVKEWKFPEIKQLPVSEKTLKFFQSRGIEERVIEYFQITESIEWMYGVEADEKKGTPAFKEGKTTCMNFPFFQDKKLINVKFRATGKRFKLSTGAKLIFFNLDAIKDSDWCAIQEGEIDTMTAYQCGVYKSVSVPNGASKGNVRLDYLDNCISHFDNKNKIIIATDDDEAGLMLRKELIRRLGPERCWVINYPDGCKDTNEVLLKYGEKAVKEMYDRAYQLPIDGIVSNEELEQRIINIYENGYPEGLKIGFKDFDSHMSFIGGQVTLWTGIPGSGKSEFIDQVMVRLSARHGWRHSIFAPENEPDFQATAIISKFVGGEMIGRDRVSEMKRDKGIQFVKDHFFFMKVDEIDVTIDGILAKAQELVQRKGVNTLLIDPYNYIEHKIPAGMTETLYVSELMSKIVRFAKMYDVHINLVAHPTKIQKDRETGKYKVPTLYDISGSANFFNKTFNGIAIYRDFEEKIVTAYIQKVKFKWIGRVGSCEFTYDYPTGRYSHVGQPFENELDRYLAKESQVDIQFDKDEPKSREPVELTDITKLSFINSLDLTPNAYEPDF